MYKPYGTDDGPLVEQIVSCTGCGGRKFLVSERTDWDAEVDDNAVLSCYSSRTGVETIHCADCGVHYAEANFADFEFN
jgi:hypothetical protein